MEILVVGSGGREHALAWKLAQSDKVTMVHTAPGNPGAADCGESVTISADDIQGLLHFAETENIGLTVVGPEAPLTMGIVDAFTEAGLAVFGPTMRAAELEGSKAFSKYLMAKYGIPTAEFGEFTDPVAAKAYVEAKGAPIVVKADGLAAGKGVILCESKKEALDAIETIMNGHAFGSAGDTIIIEEFLVGEEASFIAVTDGKTVVPFAPSQDHKAVFDGDKGPNTGGMGAYSPAPVVTPEIEAIVMEKVMIPAVKAMEKEGRPYKGFLYAGLMIKDGHIKVLEFNCRFGDPECQPILMRLRSDLLPVLLASVDGTLDKVTMEWDERAAVCVVMASGGYPGAYKKDRVITGLEEAESIEGVTVFHAGTTELEGEIVTSGGRVLGVTGLGADIKSAIDRAYMAAGKINFEGAYYRKDIGAKALK